MRRRRQTYKVGDYFAVPLCDETNGLGQILIASSDIPLSGVVCAFFSRRFVSASSDAYADLRASEMFAALFVTDDLLKSSIWNVIGEGPCMPVQGHIDFADLRARRFVGVDIIGSGNVRKLVEAYHGLFPWNGFYKPDYLDRLLLAPDRKPSKIVHKF